MTKTIATVQIASTGDHWTLLLPLLGFLVREGTDEILADKGAGFCFVSALFLSVIPRPEYRRKQNECLLSRFY